MFKAMILLKRKETLTFEAFKAWWLIDHAQLAKQLPGLRKAMFNLVDGSDDGEFDGVAELWFDSKEAFEQAYQTELGKSVAADSLSRVSKRERLFTIEHSIL